MLLLCQENMNKRLCSYNKYRALLHCDINSYYSSFPRSLSQQAVSRERESRAWIPNQVGNDQKLMSLCTTLPGLKQSHAETVAFVTEDDAG